MSSDVPPPTPVPAPASAPAKQGVSLVRLVAIALFLALLAGVAYGVMYYNNQLPPPVDTVSQLREYLKQQGRYAKLADGYTDADGDLVADPPAEAGKRLNPAELTFTTIVEDDADKSEATWKPFLDHLAATTGKKVKYLKELDAPKGEAEVGPTKLQASDQQLAALRDGKLHVTAFNTGLVQGAVNTAGFVPMYCPADKDGKFAYQMEIIVPAKSPAQTPKDLKSGGGDKSAIAFVAMSSNSGAKAPLVLLKDEFQMLPGPGRDYDFIITGRHASSIKGVADGKYPAAAVANDLLARMTAPGKDGKPEVDPAAVRSVYKSKDFPVLCFGVPHNLDPKLKADIAKAFETFSFAGNSVGAEFAAQQRVKFAKVNYKDDWAYVRQIDERLANLLDAK